MRHVTVVTVIQLTMVNTEDRLLAILRFYRRIILINALDPNGFLIFCRFSHKIIIFIGSKIKISTRMTRSIHSVSGKGSFASTKTRR